MELVDVPVYQTGGLMAVRVRVPPDIRPALESIPSLGRGFQLQGTKHGDLIWLSNGHLSLLKAANLTL